MLIMAKAKPIPVRLTDEIIDRLDRVAQCAHLSSRTEVIKICVASFLDYFEREGVVSLPLNWEEILRSMDGRTKKNITYKISNKPDLWVAEDEK